MDGSQFRAQESWVKIHRRSVSERPGAEEHWVYFVTGRAGREHATVPLVRLSWPQGCDQCDRLITPQQLAGVRSVRVQRGPSPTTLYLCATCISTLCRVCNVPPPGPGA
jgi:hypothetical protein